MSAIKMSEEINSNRRRFLSNAAMTLAAVELATSRSGAAKSRANAQSFAPLKQIDAGLLNIGYAEAGPTDGPAVLLLHGWPYDIHSFIDVAPLLASHGYRVIIPYLRGYGSTRFLSTETFRNGQQSAVALDSSLSWMLSTSGRQSSPASIGELARPTSWRCSGPNAARRLSR